MTDIEQNFFKTFGEIYIFFFLKLTCEENSINAEAQTDERGIASRMAVNAAFNPCITLSLIIVTE